MIPEDIDHARYRLRKARETLREAKTLYDGEFSVGVVNRCYYACFYAVSALLLTEGLSSSKHSGVMSLFHREWVKTGRIAPDIAAIYGRLFDRRQTGDYTDVVSFDRQDVQTWLHEAEQFVAYIAEWIAANAGVAE